MLIERILRRICLYLPEKSRYFLGGLYARAVRSRTYGGRGFPAYWQRFRETAHAGRHALLELQWRKLKTLLTHAYRHVEFYRRRFAGAGVTPDDIRAYDDLTRLPLLTKEQVRASSDELIADGVERGDLIRRRTSGSTGEALALYYDKGCCVSHRAAVARWRTSAGCDPFRDRYAHTGRHHFPRPVPGRPVFCHYDPVDNTLYMPNVRMTGEVLAEYVRKLRSFRPKVLQGVASTAYILACYMRENGVDDVRLDVFLSASDMLFPKYRKVITEVFGCEVFDTYGMVERVASAEECEVHNGMHVDMEQCVVEILDDEGRQVFDRTGEIVGTNLENYAMPLIRYRTGDLGQISRRFCPCGRESILLEKLEGRMGDFLVTPEGLTVGPTGVGNVMLRVENILEVQVIQKELGSVEVLSVWTEPPGPEDIEELMEAFRTHISPRMKVDVKVADAIPRTGAGKFKLVVSHLDASRAGAAGASPRQVETPTHPEQ